jgi:hypothetical protein
MPLTWSVDYACNPLILAGRHLLASFAEVASGGGRSFCLDVTTGALRWTAEGGAAMTKAIAGPERFLLDGCRLYDRSGLVQHWSGFYGDPVIGRDDQAIGVVEMRNVMPSPNHFWLLHRNGSAQRGPHLPGRHTSYPVLTTAGQSLFWHGGMLLAIDADLEKEVLFEDGSLADEEVACWSRLLLLPDGTLACNMSQYRDKIFSSELVLVRSDYRLAAGWWPCREGGLGGNPVFVGPPAPKDMVV